MKIKQPTLINAAEMSRQHPDTFEVLTHAELHSLTKGSLVKVAEDGERFWVQIESFNGDVLTGRVDSPTVASKSHYNDRIQFHRDNIFDIYEGASCTR